MREVAFVRAGMLPGCRGKCRAARHMDNRDGAIPTIHYSERSVTRAERRLAVNPRMAVTMRCSCGDNAV